MSWLVCFSALEGRVVSWIVAARSDVAGREGERGDVTGNSVALKLMGRNKAGFLWLTRAVRFRFVPDNSRQSSESSWSSWRRRLTNLVSGARLLPAISPSAVRYGLAVEHRRAGEPRSNARLDDVRHRCRLRSLPHGSIARILLRVPDHEKGSGPKDSENHIYPEHGGSPRRLRDPPAPTTHSPGPVTDDTATSRKCRKRHPPPAA